MTTTPIARIIDRVRVNCASALDGSIRAELYNTLTEFFQRSNIWLFELPIQIVANTNDYIIDTGQNVVVNRLMSIAQTDPKATLEYLPTDPPQFLADTNLQHGSEVNNPYFRVPRSGILMNAGTPNPIIRIGFNSGPQIWVAVLALSVVDPLDADGLPVVPTWIMQKYQDAIGDGVIARLMTQQGKPHSNDKGASFHGRKFNQGVGLARQEVRSMMAYGGQPWMFPGGWNSNRPRLY